MALSSVTPWKKTFLEALEWQTSQGDSIAPSSSKVPNASRIYIRHRFRFSSALKRMSTVSTFPLGKVLIAVKGASETIKGMLAHVPEWYDVIFKWYTRWGSRVLAPGMKDMDTMPIDKIHKLHREEVESNLIFAALCMYYPVFCIMITGDNPLTAVHVARDGEIVDGEALILDLKENAAHEADLCWGTVDESKIIPVDPFRLLDKSLFDDWNDLVQNTWVYARVSPAQKEFILASFKTLGYVTLMAGDGTNDVGALKGVALLDGFPKNLQRIAEQQVKKVYKNQLNISARLGQPPPPVPGCRRGPEEGCGQHCRV
ncbi:hypothetical protein JVT61DRAFT_10731 [Boletus reticuloceps]|uniref:P-type ATPase n=1 Tax=Boletus reticuloceps TaxID=495285 RepID=A0A8I2YFK5_9AGAM|nr:hypothetical protein JVT61DRAFT_10731 [Boletus reticuloceps]